MARTPGGSGRGGRGAGKKRPCRTCKSVRSGARNARQRVRRAVSRTPPEELAAQRASLQNQIQNYIAEGDAEQLAKMLKRKATKGEVLWQLSLRRNSILLEELAKQLKKKPAELGEMIADEAYKRLSKKPPGT